MHICQTAHVWFMQTLSNKVPFFQFIFHLSRHLIALGKLIGVLITLPCDATKFRMVLPLSCHCSLLREAFMTYFLFEACSTSAPPVSFHWILMERKLVWSVISS